MNHMELDMCPILALQWRVRFFCSPHITFSNYRQISTSWYVKNKLNSVFFIVVLCMFFQSLLYCSNSCTSLHFKTLKSHTKTLKITCFGFL